MSESSIRKALKQYSQTARSQHDFVRKIIKEYFTVYSIEIMFGLCDMLFHVIYILTFRYQVTVVTNAMYLFISPISIGN